MRLHRFYVPEKIGTQNVVILHDKDRVDQIKKVFRLRTGDSLVLFDGSGSDFECRIKSADKDQIILDIIAVQKSRYMPEKEIYLVASVVKKDTFEWIVQKATELGVTHIIPIISERSEKKSLNHERLVKISTEASEQCGRGDVPNIESVTTLHDVLSSEIRTKIFVLFAFHTEGFPLFTENIKSSCAVFIGPEGGWSPEEVQAFQANKIEIRCLGSQVLRAETAVIATLSKIVFGN